MCTIQGVNPANNYSFYWYIYITNDYQIERRYKQEFEDTKGVIRTRIYQRRTDNTIAKRQSTKGQTTIYKTYI
jgi:hypothetical protein